MLAEIDNPQSFASAYRQIRPAARVVVDRYIADVEREAERTNAVRPISIVSYSTRDQAVLAEPLVQAALAERIRDVIEALELSPRKVMKEISAIAFASLAHYMTVDAYGDPVFNLSLCTPAQMSAIKSVEIEESTTLNGGSKRKFKFQLHDKLAALGHMINYMGLDKADNPHWQSDKARNVTPPKIAANASDEGAADLYHRMINNHG